MYMLPFQYIFMQKRKTATSVCLLQIKNGNGKLLFVFLKLKKRSTVIDVFCFNERVHVFLADLIESC
jgi:hypothetical protein